MFQAYYQSPLGLLHITANATGILSILFVEEAGDMATDAQYNKVLSDCLQQLDEYFAGTRNEFDLPLQPKGTDFQQQVWDHLQHIPYGTTITYHDIAWNMGNEGAVRAVGAANGNNPIAIVIPCHRVIGANGQLTGYAGGLWRKEWLLRHENALAQGTLFSLN